MPVAMSPAFASLCACATALGPCHCKRRETVRTQCVSLCEACGVSIAGVASVGGSHTDCLAPAVRPLGARATNHYLEPTAPIWSSAHALRPRCTCADRAGLGRYTRYNLSDY